MGHHLDDSDGILMDAYKAKQLMKRVEELEAEVQALRLAFEGARHTTTTGTNGYTTFPNYSPIWYSNHT